MNLEKPKRSFLIRRIRERRNILRVDLDDAGYVVSLMFLFRSDINSKNESFIDKQIGKDKLTKEPDENETRINRKKHTDRNKQKEFKKKE